MGVRKIDRRREVYEKTSPDPVGVTTDLQASVEGDRPGGQSRVLRLRTYPDKGRSRNLVIPDSLYDNLCIYAKNKKVRVKDEIRENGRVIRPALIRSMTVSEAACEALESIPKLTVSKARPAADKPTTADQAAEQEAWPHLSSANG
jgi:hypothetical protein